MHGYGRSTDFLYQAYVYLYDTAQLVLQALQTIIHHLSKVFTTGQARVTSEHHVIKCVVSDKFPITSMAFLTLLCAILRTSIKPKNHFSTLFIT